MTARGEVTLGILAGGRGSRLGGRDKAWLMRDGVPQVVRIARRFEGECTAVLVSANRDLPRHAAHGLRAVVDRIADRGPLGGIEALASACETPWLLTMPVDLVDPGDGLLRTLASASCGDGAVRAMQARLALPRAGFAGLRFGNLNTPDDLRRAGCDDA